MGKKGKGAVRTLREYSPQSNGLVVPGKSRFPHVTLAIFAYANVRPDTLDCIVRDMLAWPRERIHYARVSNDALIDRSRARVASQFLDNKDAGDILIMIDHDMFWKFGDLEHLARACERTRAIVGGVYSKRSFADGITARFAEYGTFVQGSDRLVKSVYVSTGFMAIHRDVLERLAGTLPRTLGNFWPFFVPTLGEREWAGRPTSYEYLSEDWAFCQRAAAQEVPIYADLYPTLTHVGDYGYRVIDAGFNPPPDVPVNFTIAPPPTGRAMHKLLDDLAEYSEVAPDVVGPTVMKARQNLAAAWHLYGGFDKEEEWYRRDDVGRCYIYDLAGWQLDSLVEAIEGQLGGISGKRCLDFGAGIGTMAFHLADQGNEVDFVEPNERMREFIAYRAKRLDLHPRHVDTPDSLYDLIVCWHVLEHLPHPQSAAVMLIEHLAQGGLVYTDSDFVADDVHPMHHSDGHAAHGEDIWAAAGLVPAWEGTLHWWKRAGETAWREPPSAEVSDAHPPAD